MNARIENRNGFALATAILALVVVGALVTAGFYAAQQEGRVGTSNAQSDLAFYIADQGVQDALGNVRKADVRKLALGSKIDRSGSVTVGARTVGTYATTIRSVGAASDSVFFIESTGTVTQGGRYAGATRRLGMLVRTLRFSVPKTQALMAFGGINLRGAASINGVDQQPSAWPSSDCDSLAATEAGVLAKDASTVTGKTENIVGDPAIEEDTSMTKGQFLDYGDLDYDNLKSMATIVFGTASLKPLPAYKANGDCDSSVQTNWGEPKNSADKCYDYFPVVYASGDLTVGGNGYGQGILLVDGNLTISGGFEFYGIIIVLGSINQDRGSGNAELHGVVMTMNDANIDEYNELKGTPVLQFSTCSVDRAVLENESLSRLVPYQERSWVDLTASGAEL